jgi:hypothetical protein
MSLPIDVLLTVFLRSGQEEVQDHWDIARRFDCHQDRLDVHEDVIIELYSLASFTDRPLLSFFV